VIGLGETRVDRSAGYQSKAGDTNDTKSPAGDIATIPDERKMVRVRKVRLGCLHAEGPFGSEHVMITMHSAVAVLTVGAAAEIGARPHQTHCTLLRRLLDSLIESRMSRAEREIREHLNFLPDDVLRRAGYRVRRRRSSLGTVG
jgi:hypothetical protein